MEFVIGAVTGLVVGSLFAPVVKPVVQATWAKIKSYLPKQG